MKAQILKKIKKLKINLGRLNENYNNKVFRGPVSFVSVSDLRVVSGGSGYSKGSGGKDDEGTTSTSSGG